MSTYGDLHINWDGVNAPKSGWERPKTGELHLNTFKNVRDDALLRVLSNLQLRDTHDIVSVDNESPSRPLQVSWDEQVTSVLSWTEAHGVIGSGIVIKRRFEDGSDRFVGMIQVGGAVLDDFQMEYNTHPIVRARYSASQKKWIALSVFNCFASPWGLAFLGRNANSTEVWHRVSEEDWEKMLNLVVDNCRRIG